MFISLYITRCRTTKFIEIDRHKECPKQTIKNHWASPVLKGPKADHQRHWIVSVQLGSKQTTRAGGRLAPLTS